MKSIAARLKKIPPAVVVLGVAIAIVAGLGAARLFHIREVDARVVEEREARRRHRQAQGHAAAAARDPEDSPAFREAYRVQETSGLALGLTVVAIEHRLRDGAPVPTVGELVEAARTRGMLPPKAVVTSPGALAGPHSLLFVRYRPDPVGVEVVSIPRESIEADGPPMLARVTSEVGAEFFTLLREAMPVEVPRAFQSAAHLEAARWKREILKDFGPESGQTEELLRTGKEVRP